MKEDKEIKYLYDRYLNNTCTEEEMGLFLDLLQQDHPEVMKLMSSTWQEDEEVEVKQRKFKIPFLISAAAVMILVLGSLFFFKPDLISVFFERSREQVVTVAGEYKQVELEDGTRVWLSPNSKLHYPGKFKNGYREVNLLGEGFFEVKHDPAHPFVITTGEVLTTVLGTSFNVSAYPIGNTVKVTLLTGNVMVSFADQKKQHVMILPNEQVVVNQQKEEMIKSVSADAHDFLNRRIGLFAYHGAALSEVVNDVETRYGVEIELDPLSGDQSFTGNLNMAHPVTEILSKLCLVAELKWKKTKTGYKLGKKPD